jgi:hypothetical protein
MTKRKKPNAKPRSWRVSIIRKRGSTRSRPARYQIDRRNLDRQSTVFGNTTGVEATGGALLRSFGDNYIAGNQSDGTPTATVPRK